MTFNESLIEFARRWLFVREAGGANLGFWISLFQRVTGSEEGASWCASFVSFVLSVMFGGRTHNPVPISDSCQIIYAHAIKAGWVTDSPVPGDLFVYVNAADHAHHIGFVAVVSLPTMPPTPEQGIAGNTSPDGKSSNGDGVHEHATVPPTGSTIKYIAYPRPETWEG